MANWRWKEEGDEKKLLGIKFCFPPEMVQFWHYVIYIYIYPNCGSQRNRSWIIHNRGEIDCESSAIMVKSIASKIDRGSSTIVMEPIANHIRSQRNRNHESIVDRDRDSVAVRDCDFAVDRDLPRRRLLRWDSCMPVSIPRRNNKNCPFRTIRFDISNLANTNLNITMFAKRDA